jgi:hypothetical protein
MVFRLLSQLVVELSIDNNKIMESKIKESTGNRIISSNKILSGNEKDIKDVLNKIAKIHNISIEDAALALSNTLKNFRNSGK